METTKTKLQKTSLVKQAAWLAALNAAIIISNIVLMFKAQIPFTAEDYLKPFPLPMLMTFVLLILLVTLLVLSIIQFRNTEKDDELSKYNRYKAGYISKYICIVAIIAAIWIIKDFNFAFKGDLYDDFAQVPLIIFMFAQFVENITFIILEKRNLE